MTYTIIQLSKLNIMKIELTRDTDNKIVGYKMIKESNEDTNIIEIIRDMHFFGFGETLVKYDGRSSDDNDDTIELRFNKEWYAKQEDKRIADHFRKTLADKYPNLNL